MVNFNVKGWWKSKLFWTGVIQCVIAIVGFIENNGGTAMGYSTMATGILTIIFRVFFTSTKLTK
tara:strand:- start:1019 stop:1210 length:192 start_codon:yes stop_codon:yes gene_type:complete